MSSLTRPTSLGLFCLALCLACVLPARADIPAGYYNAVNTATSATLRSTLNDLITRNFTMISYNTGLNGSSGDALRLIDEDPSNTLNVLLMYGAAESRGKISSGVLNGSATSGDWSREHIFPRSSYDDLNPMFSDLHNLFPADADLNNTRSNKYYDDVPTPTYGPDAYGNEATNTPDAFEVNATDRGFAARAVFYMDLRYEGESGERDLYLTENPGLVGTGQNVMARLSTLMNWHVNDPPDVRERLRNNNAYDLQGNANPFIDHPEYAQILYSGASAPVDGDLPTVAFVNRAPAAIGPNAVDVPMLTINLALAANEWDIAELDLARLGTLANARVDAVKLWLDCDADGLVDAGEPLLDSGVFDVGGNLTFSLNPAWRLPAGSRSLLVSVSLANALTGATFGVQVSANGLRHSSGGGADLDPAHAAYSSHVSEVSTIFPVRIVMVSTCGSTGLAAQEFLVLANESASAIDLSNWYLRSRAASTTSTLTIPSGTIPAFGHFVIGSSAYGGIVEGVTADYTPAGASGLFGSGMGDATGRSFGLFDPDGDKQDGFSINSGPSILPDTLAEGAPFTDQPNSAIVSTMRQRPGGSHGPYADTGDNMNDLTNVNSKTPPTDRLVPVELSHFVLE